MIEIVEGNLLEAKENIIGHQVNCIGVMGAGLVKQIKNKYPGAYSSYKRHCKRMPPELLLGDNLIVEVDKDKYVSNLFGQIKYGRDQQHTDYAGLKIALIKLEGYARKNNLSVVLPYGIGAGLAGGDWSVIYKIIEDVFDEYDVTLYKL